MEDKPTYEELILKIQELSTAKGDLQKRIERYELAFEAADDGLWEFDPRTGKAFYSNLWFKMLGYEKDEFPQDYSTWAGLLHPDDKDEAETTIQKYITKKLAHFSIEIRMRAKNGGWRWIHSRGKTFAEDTEGDISRVVGTHVDITERRELEKALLINKFIFDKGSVGIYLIGEDGKILDINQKGASILGYLVEDLRGKFISYIDPLVNSDNWGGIWERLVVGRVDKFERFHLHKDGTQVPVEITSNFFEHDSIPYSIAFVQDISERKEKDKILRDNERYYRELFTKAPIAYVLMDNNIKEPYINEINQRFLDLVGYTKEEVVGTPLKSYYTKSSAEKLLKGSYARSLTGKFLIEDRDLATKDGRVINTIMHAQPVCDDDNVVVGARAAYLDVTERKEAEKEAKRLETALIQGQKMEAIGTLAGGVAHDFNNILGIIVGYTQLAQLNIQEDQETQKFLTQALIATERAKNLVEQILAFSRQGTLEKIPVDMGIICNEVLKLMRSTIPSTIEIQKNIKSNLGAVQGNQIQLHQVIVNLCTNASHAMGNSGGILAVDLNPLEISANDLSSFQDISPGSYLRLSVADNGHGMTEDIKKKIFEPYYTTKEIGEGTGMGLATVHGIVKDHGGDIKVYSVLGIGTTFHVLFPVVDEEIEIKADLIKKLPRGIEQILIVDDEQSLVDIDKKLLEKLGYIVDTRISPVDALKAFRASPEKYDLIITDFAMPKLNGEKFIREIKTVCPTIPIILCTGFSEVILPRKAEEIGINSILLKPYTVNDLASTVRKVLDINKKTSN